MAKEGKAEVEFFTDDKVPDVGVLTEQNLFSKAKVFVLAGLTDKLGLDEAKIALLVKSPNHIVLLEEKLDKRTSSNKTLLLSKGVTVQEFLLPHGRELNAWITARSKALGVTMDVGAVEELARRLGRDEALETKFGGKVVEIKEYYNLWQADSEIQKLKAYANGKGVTQGDVEQMVGETREADTLSIVNAIAEQDKFAALSMVKTFLQTDVASDEKSRIIQLSALLAEQFRSIFMVQGFLKEGITESEILQKTGWKSGRLFMVKKTAVRFAEKKVSDLLHKLEMLDEELKSSNTPPSVLLDLILVQLF